MDAMPKPRPSRGFASRDEHCSPLGEVEKRNDGVFNKELKVPR
jgi:hypothetical protein